MTRSFSVARANSGLATVLRIASSSLATTRGGVPFGALFPGGLFLDNGSQRFELPAGERGFDLGLQLRIEAGDGRWDLDARLGARRSRPLFARAGRGRCLDLRLVGRGGR